jgi:hypothetical protein
MATRCREALSGRGGGRKITISIEVEPTGVCAIRGEGSKAQDNDSAIDIKMTA